MSKTKIGYVVLSRTASTGVTGNTSTLLPATTNMGREGMIISNRSTSLSLYVYSVDKGEAAPTFSADDYDIAIPPNGVAFVPYSSRVDVYFQNSSGVGTTSAVVVQETDTAFEFFQTDQNPVGGAGAGDASAANQATEIAALAAIQASVQLLDDQVVAHDAVDSGYPMKIGAKAVAHGANPTAVAAGDRTDIYANRAGVQFVIGGHPNATPISIRVLDADGAQTNIAMVTVAGGLKIVVTRATIKTDGSNTNPVNGTIGFGAATLATPNTTSGAGIVSDYQGCPAGGGSVDGDGSGIIGVGADGEDLRYTCEDPVGGAITLAATYYTIES